jgi:DNA ligase-1
MFVSPMLLQYAADNKPFNNDEWFTELKLDGIRLIPSHIERPRLYTRHENEITANFPELIDSMPIPEGTILDSELIVLGADGKPDFEATMERFKSKKSKHKPHVVAFDIIKYKGTDVTGLPLSERKKLLDGAFESNEYYTKSIYWQGKGVEYFQAIQSQGLEGVVLKQADSKYEVNKRSDKWQKVIAYEMDQFYLAGYSKGKSGWLLSDGNKIVGNMEFGPSKNERIAGYEMMRRYKTKETKNYLYCQPLMRCLVKHRGYYKSGMLRLPIFEKFVI